jgi:hypothetical protein
MHITQIWRGALAFSRKTTQKHKPGRSRRQTSDSPARLESLESRIFLAVNPIITEFMASNSSGLKDQDGDTSDWIELNNPTTTAINLDGYYLTNDPLNLQEWRFPAVTMPAGSYLVVFASAKNRAVAGSQLHTNFTLDAAHGYLGLIQPDGITVASDYAPEYPQQLADVSYGQGLNFDSSTLINAGTLANVLVPPDGSLGSSWTGLLFDDSSWTSGITGVGFQQGGSLPVEQEPNDTAATANSAATNFTAYSSNLFHLGLKGTTTSGAAGDDWFKIGPMQAGDILTVTNSGAASARGTQLDPTVELWRGTPAAPVLVTSNTDDGPGLDALINRFVITTGDTYYIKAKGGSTGTYNLGLWLENNALAPATDAPFTTETEPNDVITTANDASQAWRAVQYLSRTTAAITSAADVDLYQYQFTAGDLVTINIDSTSGLDAKVSLVNSVGAVIASEDGTSAAAAPFNNDSAIYSFIIPTTGTYQVLVQSSNGTTGSYNADVYLSTTAAPVGSTSYGSLIQTDIGSQMFGVNSSVYIRVPFNVDDPTDFTILKLRMKYDDGFVAYINGVEVARRNAPVSLTFNSAATATHQDTQATTDEEIDISSKLSQLQIGNNVLSIQGLNSNASNPNFLIVPSLEGSAQVGTAPRYFSKPTPGTPNNLTTQSGIVADTKFSIDRGFYVDPFDVAITTATVGAQIRYTIDGSAPTATTGIVYTGPISVTGTTVLRAAGFLPGMLASNIDSQTYVFMNDVIRQSANGQPPAGWPATWGSNVKDYGMDPDVVNNAAYKDTIINDIQSIPSMSIVVNLKDLFDPATGIYANPSRDGRLWERPASLELLNPDGTSGFQINMGLRIRGGFSRDTSNPKHAFRFFFRSQYGDSTLNYPLFGPDAAQSFNSIDLRTFQNYSWSFGGDPSGVFIRDQLSRDAQLAQGEPASHGKYYNLYINGEYWGLYNTDERPESDFSTTYFGASAGGYDTIKVNPGAGYTIYATDGDMTAWTKMWNLAKGNLSSATAYQKLLGNNPDGTRNPAYDLNVDVDNLIDYMLVIYYGGNLDAPISNFIGNTNPNNFFATRPRDGSHGFRFFTHDSEHTLLNVNESRIGPYPAGNTLGTSNPQWLFQQMWANPEFKLRVADHMHAQFFNGGPLTPQSSIQRFLARKNEIDRAVVGESARWGDSKVSTPLTRDTNWVAEINRIANSYLPTRSGIVFLQLVSKGLYPNVLAPEFSQHGGPIVPGFPLTINNFGGQGVVYYTLDGTDPRLLGGLVSPMALLYTGPITLNGSVRVQARVLANGTWSALDDATFTVDAPALTVSELMYHPAAPAAGSPYVADDFEYIELQNAGTSAINLKGDNFTNGITFTFPDMILEAGERTLLVANPAAFKSRYAAGANIAGTYTGSLSNSGETITLVGPLGQKILSFDYKDSWYPITDGDGYSLVLADPTANGQDLSDVPSWRPSNLVNGNPGGADPGFAPGSVVISEAMTNSTTPGGDFIELQNTTGSPIDISGWFLSDATTKLAKYEIQPGTIIPAHGFVTFIDGDTYGNAAAPGALIPFGLSFLGTDIFLSSGDGAGHVGGYREKVSVNAAEPDVSFGLYTTSDGKTDFTELLTPTPAAPNAGPVIGPVVINELLYDPTPGGVEFIELQNLSATDAPLYDPANPDNPWKFIDGIVFSFPAGATIPAAGYAIVVPIDPATYRSTFNIPASVPIYGPYTGALNNAGEDVELAQPGAPVGAIVPYIRVDKVRYNDKSPWPDLPLNSGSSISRLSASAYGNDPASWIGGPIGGTPGAPNAAPTIAPTVSFGSDLTINQGVNFTRAGSFTDPDTGQKWTATVNWGDSNIVMPLTLTAAKGFNLNHAYLNPGTFTITVTVTDSSGGSGSSAITMTVLPGTRAGSALAERYILRLDPTGTFVQFFENGQTGVTPSYSVKRSALGALTFNGAAGNDILDIDLTNGNPLPDAGLTFGGGTNTDILHIIGNANTVPVSISATQATIGNINVNYNTAEQIQLDGGTYTLTADLKNVVPNLVAGRNAVVHLNTSQHLTSLILNDAAQVTLAAGGSKFLRTTNLAIGPNAVLDLTDNDMILQSDATNKASVLAAVTGLIKTARNGGAWNGLGLTSSFAASQANHITGLVAIVNDKGDGTTIHPTFDGEIVDANAVLIKYTYNGDINVDGLIDADDYFAIDLGFAKSLSGYANGDLDYNGVIDADDYFLIDRAFTTQSGPLASGQVVAKPAAASPRKARHHRAPRRAIA